MFKELKDYIFYLTLILITVIIVLGALRFRTGDKVVSVTGSAEKTIESDLIIWSGNFEVINENIKDAYEGLEKDENIIREYLKTKGIDEKDIIFTSIRTNKNYVYDRGMRTNEISDYTLNRSFKITSKDVDKVTEVSNNITELISEGVNISSHSPRYIYTKLQDLKIETAEEAALNAKERAQALLSPNNDKLGKIKLTNQGVYQITPEYSTNVSNYGINDTSSKNKKIMAIVKATYLIK